MAADRMYLTPQAKAFQSMIFDLFDLDDLSDCHLSVFSPIDKTCRVRVCADAFYTPILRKIAASGIPYFIHYDDRFGLTAVLYVSTDLC